jgi:hypothetical protein
MGFTLSFLRIGHLEMTRPTGGIISSCQEYVENVRQPEKYWSNCGAVAQIKYFNLCESDM